MKSTRPTGRQLVDLRLREGSLSMEYCATPQGIERYFTPETRLASFPPDGVAHIFELDYYYLIKREDRVVGYYKAVDLFFDGVVELHGSYDGPTDFGVRSYFMLSRQFVYGIQRMFPDKTIRTLILRSNTKIVRLLEWLHFEPVQADDTSGLYECWELKDTSMLSFCGRLIHWFYRP